MANIVLIEPFYGGSHQAWADAWIDHSRHDVVLISHPDQFWRWRLRGGSVTLAEAFIAHVEQHGPPDAVVVSGMVDVAAFVGHARRALASRPVAMYLHESQLLYPSAPNQRQDNAAALTNWRSMAAADALWFNSAFHRDAIAQALPALLAAQPEPTHEHLIRRAFENTTVLWPGVVADQLIAGHRTPNRVPRVLWNQRWDHDKNPSAVFSALAAVAARGIEFTVALAGENQRPESSEFDHVTELLGDRVDYRGFAPQADYERLLLSSDVVVSAADHEFFGIALVEAMAAGAVPVLPTRLSFPELVPPGWHDVTLYPDGELRLRLAEVLSDIGAAQEKIVGLRASMARFDVEVAAVAHDDAVDALLG